jgi:hypothetical protein
MLLGGLIAFTAGMVFYEAFLRFSGSSSPSIVESDREYGVRLIKDTQFIFVNEGFSLGEVNEYGYLGPGYPPEKPEGVLRIALMGDSYVAGHQLFDRHHYRYHIEKDLRASTGAPVQVLNFGFPATNFEQMYLRYLVFAEDFSPDYVLYFIGRNSLSSASDEIGPRLELEADTLRVDNSFLLSQDFARARQLDPLKRLGLFTLWRKAREVYLSGSTLEVIFDKFYRLAAGGGESGPEDETPGNMSRRAPLNRAIIERLAAENRDGDTQNMIVLRGKLPRPFVEFAASRGVRCFDPTPGLDSLAADGIDPHYWKGSQRSGHWNQYAHRVVAAYLTRKLTPLLRARAERQ